ncbi:MAG: gliding motility protein GldN [Bacteroidetes bacterium]|nr:gliding motility protein GldN [Bacteroidota bacterium]MCK6611807.1 gliding motility protein GldN [Bacteroidia bacterium]
MIKKSLVVLLFGILSFTSFAQGVYDDFIYNRQAVTERKVIPWPYLREADVFFAKRIVRVIDVREKQNQPMAWPKNPLSVILYNNIKEGKIIPYTNDSLSSQMSIEYFLTLGTDTDYIETPIDPNDPSLTETDTIITPMVPELRIQKYRVVEDWLFDKKHSQMYVRIVSIAPRYNVRIKGIDLGEQDLCVLKYHAREGSGENDLRHLLVNYEIFNRQNDAARLTYDDWFENRLFTSYITKEANQHDMYIKEYDQFKDNGVASLLEGERIKQELFEKEHDYWEY